MRIPSRPGGDFGPREIDLLAQWRDRLSQSEKGRRIVEIIESEENIPRELEERFLKNLLQRIEEGDDPVSALSKAVAPDMLLRGPEVPRKSIPPLLSRIVSVKRLLPALRSSIPVFRDRRTEEQVFTWLRDGVYTLEDLFEPGFLDAKPIFWATSASEVDRLKAGGHDVDDLCDHLGLGIPECDWVAELRYRRNRVRNVRKPTILESRAQSAFEPSPRTATTGTTRNLRTGEPGLPEVVHEPVARADLETIAAHGHRSRGSQR